MKIPSKEIPQADTLRDVVAAVEAVAAGHTSFQEIAASIGKGQRQGRYYRLAAEILGLLQRSGRNRAAVTRRGRALVRAEGEHRDEVLAEALLSARIVQRLLPFLETRGLVSRDDITRFVTEVSDVGSAATGPRRVSTLCSWLTEVGILEEVNGHYRVGEFPPQALPVMYANLSEPLFPRRFNLEEYREFSARGQTSKQIVAMYIDEAKRERARSAHRLLVSLMVERIRQGSVVPRQSALIDLAAEIRGQPYVFEMKSMTADNALSQIRRGISQLYEYRYCYRPELDGAKLCLVMEARAPARLRWMEQYLIEDRDILPIWNGQGRLSCPDEIADMLPFLA